MRFNLFRGERWSFSRSPKIRGTEKGDYLAASEWLGNLLDAGFRLGASDLHLTHGGQGLSAHIRLHGRLCPLDKVPPPQAVAGLFNQLRVWARLNPEESRVPQDAWMDWKGRQIRLALLPSLEGESAVLRLLSGEALSLDSILSLSGLCASTLTRAASGLILVVGATGSGKTTTLNAWVRHKVEQKLHILTLEDPVEYPVPQALMVSVQPEIGLDFASGLKAFLRHDPDVIVIGEIRDAITLNTALEAALAGKLVLSTLHAADACGALVRLRHMGATPDLLAGGLRAVLAQQLLPIPCNQEACAAWRSGPLAPMALGAASWSCEICHDTGYQGRQAICEYLPITESFWPLFQAGASEVEFRAQALKEGLQPFALHRRKDEREVGQACFESGPKAVAQA